MNVCICDIIKPSERPQSSKAGDLLGDLDAAPAGAPPAQVAGGLRI